MMRSIFVLVVVCLAVAPLLASPDIPSDAVEVLNKATATTRKLTAITYDAAVYAEGGLADAYPKMSEGDHRTRPQ